MLDPSTTPGPWWARYSLWKAPIKDYQSITSVMSTPSTQPRRTSMQIDARDVLVNIAKSFKWVRETNGSNRGEVVDEMIRLTSLDPNGRYPWCAAFVAYCGYATWRKLWPLKKVAGCVSLYDDAKAKGLIMDAPAHGAIFLLYSEKKHRFHHTGFVDADLGNGRWSTVEGNTNDDGSVDGVGVFERDRRFGPDDKFIYPWLYTGAAV